MELVKKNIHMNRWKGNAATQITLDDDFIVPDTMDDMAQVILNTGDIQVESVKNQGEKVLVKGKLSFQALYRKAEGGLQTLAGTIPFEEQINVAGLEEKDYIGISWELDDLNAGMINSRKLSIKAIVTLEVRVETLYDVEAASDIEQGEMPGAETVQIESLKRSIEVAAIAARRKDTYRIKEDISLSGSKPNMDQILWSEMRLRGVQTKPLDGEIHVEGELTVFVIYAGEGEETPMQWLEEGIPFSGELALPEVVEEMIPLIAVRLIHKELDMKPDYDGEMRELSVDAVLELDMKLYEEQQVDLLSDLYSTNRELELQSKEVCFDRLLTKNTGKCKISEKVAADRAGQILQICHNDGMIKIDEIELKEDALQIEGVLEVYLLYLTSDDAEPIRSSTEIVPFHYLAEAPGIHADSTYQLNSGLEQLTAVMLGSDTIEIKAVIALDILVLQPVCEPVITGAAASKVDMQKLQKLPGIVGYIVQPGDSLWNIAKKFHTTVDNIISTNGLTDAQIHPGDRLILVKEIVR
ncbi:MAG: DUF3794 domain-containing protein [Hungatella sp.]